MPIFQTQDNPSATHNHDSLYYTQAAADSAFSAAGHDHDSDYSATTHDHDSDYMAVDAALGDLSNVTEAGKDDGMSLVWNAGAGTWNPATVTSGGGVTDHGALTGLGDDDHSQYHNDARGDARYALIAHNHDSAYYTETEVNNLLTGYSATSHNHDASYAAAAHTHDTRYYTETEMDVLLAAKSATTHNHSGVYAAASHTHDDRYYTETEMDSLLSGKSNTTHIHDSGTIGTTLLGSGVAYTWGTGWTDFGGSAAPVKIKAIGNMCYLFGLPKRTSSSNVYKTILTLAPEYRPTDGNHYYSTYYVYGTANNTQQVEVNTDGTVKIQLSPSTAIEYVYIDGFCWPI